MALETPARAEEPSAREPGGPAAADPSSRRGRSAVTVLLGAAVLAVVVVVHLWLGATLVRQAWTGWGLAAVAVAVLAKVALAHRFARPLRDLMPHHPRRH